MPNPTTKSAQEYSGSRNITAPLVDGVCRQQWQLDYLTESDQIAFKSQVLKEKREAQSAEAVQLYSHLPPALRKSIELAREKGSSSCLTVLPNESHGFSLHKGAFLDSIQFLN